jgi:hypothetical protein
MANNSTFSTLLIAISIALAGYFIGNTMYNSKVALNTAEAKGLAERRVKSDKANWTISFTTSGSNQTAISDLYSSAEKDQETIIDLLKDNGFSDKEISVGVIDYNRRVYRDDNQKIVDESIWLSGSINVETNNVDIVNKVRGKVNKLIAKGISISNGQPSYHFTRLNEIKPEMLSEATKNARIAANEFAENAGVEVGGIRDARQGSFFIRDAGEDYGDTQKIEKEVRVVTTITFYLTE